MKISRGATLALASAALFGASTPLAKRLVGEMPPVLVAGLLYLGSGAGLGLFRIVRHGQRGTLSPREMPWLAGAIVFGGIVAPVLLMAGLRSTPAAVASLLLNLEGVFTAVLAWFVFHENFDRRIALGMVLIVGGGLVLSWQPGGSLGISAGALAVIIACLCWAVDNNLTQKVSGADPVTVAATKGSVAGVINVAMAFAVGAAPPPLPAVLAALAVGLVGYGVSLALFVLALRHLGTARTGAYFSIAPFVGAAASLVLFREPIGLRLAAAGILMMAGVWLHLSERHQHEHRHEALAHMHRHVHDEHHRHEHAEGIDPREPHTHAHRHEPLTHTHPHYPDIHHRHRH